MPESVENTRECKVPKYHALKTGLKPGVPCAVAPRPILGTPGTYCPASRPAAAPCRWSSWGRCPEFAHVELLKTNSAWHSWQVLPKLPVRPVGGSHCPRMQNGPGHCGPRRVFALPARRGPGPGRARTLWRFEHPRQPYESWWQPPRDLPMDWGPFFFADGVAGD